VNDVPFLSGSNNYALLLNIDWLQPYKHVVYSVGVMQQFNTAGAGI